MAEFTHREVLKRFDDHWQADRTNREDAIDDLKFCAGDQWPDSVRQQRERDGRPVITINRMGQFVKRVSGSLRQSYPAIDPFPVDDKTDPILADIYAGLIRQIEYVSSAGSVYAWAAECAIRCGIGHWQVKTRYQNEGFNQEIYLCRITDPLSVTWDSGAVELDRSDAYECFVSELITKDEYYRRWPEQQKAGTVQASFPDAPNLNSQLYWQSDDRIRIASRWFKQPKKKTLGMTATGEVFDLTKLAPISIQALGITRERKVDDWEIMHQPVSGDDFLDDAKLWPGRYIPIIPVIGEEVPLEGNVVRHGIIRWAKDPQRLYNYWRSASAEMIATAPKAPWLVSSKMIAGREAMWARANLGNPSVLVYEPDDGAPTLTPKRQDMAHPPVAMWQEATIAQDDMKAAIGIYDAALGQKSNETSGVAIEARQQEADTGSFVYFDNFNHSMHRGGVILVDLIGSVMDGEQQVRIIGKDEKEGFVPINKAVSTIDGPAIINDLSTAKFDVRIKTGPSYANAKAEAKAGLNLIIQSDPQLMGSLGDLWAETQDFPPDIKEKLVQRMKKMVPPGLNDEPAPPDPMQQMAVQTQLEEAQAKIKKLEAEAFDKEQTGIGKQIDNQSRMINVAEHGIEPPAHVQKQQDREHDLHKTNMGHAIQMSEAERGRQFTQQQAAQQPAQ